MTNVDTSAEAVERLAAELCARWDDVWDFLVCRVKAAATLRALLAERDAAKAEADRRTHEVELTYLVQRRLTTERDAARSEIERMRQALKFYACDCAKLGDECGERLNDVLCGNTAREALKEKENDQ